MFYKNVNVDNRRAWLARILRDVPTGSRVLDAGAGELRNKPLCAHLDYVSQDFGRYEGIGDGKGLHTGKWDTSNIDLISDIVAIPQANASFDVILCSEVFEHIPEPLRALDEFRRLLKPGGKLILTAPFASFVHFAPYHYCSGFSRYWYEYHLPRRGFQIQQLNANGDWFAVCLQEIVRLGYMERKHGSPLWPLGYALSFLGVLYFKLRSKRVDRDLACFGWHCVAVRQ